MQILTLVLLTLAGAWALAYQEARLSTWTIGAGLWLLIVSLIMGLSWFIGLCWLAWLVLAALNNEPWRHRFVVAPILTLFRKLLPPISATEQEALDAGSVWWDAELFSGRPDWRVLLETPAAELSAEEQAFIEGPVRELCAMLDDWKITHELKDLPPEVWRFIREHGFLGMIIPKRYGGKEFSAAAHSAVVSMISTRSSSTAVTVMVPNSLGPAELLLRYGTEAQKDHYLPRLAAGQELPCFALTSPYAGSDAASIPDMAVVCEGEYEGEKVLGLSVTWEKRYITLGPVATLLGLAFHTRDPDHLLGDREELGITLALIPTDHPGVNIGRRHFPGKQAFQNGPNSGKDVFIPMSMVIGEQEQIGQGWRMLMNALAAGRGISLPALGTAATKFAARMSGTYARVRQQFNMPIGRFEGVEEVLGRLAGQAYATESARRLTVAGLDQGQEPSVISALMKYSTTERQRQAINDAFDIHGGRAICEGPANYLANAYQAIPVSITVEGANILTRSLITFGQGAIRCHPWLLKELDAAHCEDAEESVARFDCALGGHTRFVLGNFGKTLWHNLSGGRFIKSPVNGPTAHWFRQVERACLNFALLADVTLMLLGGELKRREKLSGRFADILAELYFMTAVLKRYEDEGRRAEDLPFVKWNCVNGLYIIQSRIGAILENYPSRVVAWLLVRVLFPLGRQRRVPRDHLGRQLAEVIMTPSEQRDRLTDGIYIGTGPDDITGCMEYALERVIAAEPVEKRLRQALREGRLQAVDRQARITEAGDKGLLSEAEVRLLQETDVAIRRAIDVDDFEPSELGAASDNATIAQAEVA